MLQINIHTGVLAEREREIEREMVVSSKGKKEIYI